MQQDGQETEAGRARLCHRRLWVTWGRSLNGSGLDLLICKMGLQLNGLLKSLQTLKFHSEYSMHCEENVFQTLHLLP